MIINIILFALSLCRSIYWLIVVKCDSNHNSGPVIASIKLTVGDGTILSFTPFTKWVAIIFAGWIYRYIHLDRATIQFMWESRNSLPPQREKPPSPTSPLSFSPLLVRHLLCSIHPTDAHHPRHWLNKRTNGGNS